MCADLIFDFLDINARNIVREPTLPINMNVIITNLPSTFKVELPPMLKPAGVIADITSNHDSIKEKPG